MDQCLFIFCLLCGADLGVRKTIRHSIKHKGQEKERPPDGSETLWNTVSFPQKDAEIKTYSSVGTGS